MIGIYKITCGDKWYFGQSIDTDRRSRTHRRQLRANRHNNTYLQNTYNKHQDFKFEVIMECPVEELDFYEQMILDVWHGEPECMNLEKYVGFPTRGRPCSDERKQKTRDSNLGLKRSEETKANVKIARATDRAKAVATRLSNYSHVICCTKGDEQLIYPSINEAARQLGMQRSTIKEAIKRNGTCLNGWSFEKISKEGV